MQLQGLAPCRGDTQVPWVLGPTGGWQLQDAAQATGGPHAKAFRRRSQGSLSRAAQAQMRPQAAKLHDSMHC